MLFDLANTLAGGCGSFASRFVALFFFHVLYSGCS